MKNKKIEINEEKKEWIYCTFVVVVLILLLLGDQIALRFIRKNPNPNNTVFKANENMPEYKIDFLKELSMDEVLEKIKDKEYFFLLSSRDSCETCKKYLPDLKSVFEEYNLMGYYINREMAEESLEQFLNIDERLQNHFNYTPYLMVFQNGNLKDEVVGRIEKNKLEDFVIKNRVTY